jgi:hypothetical protein
LSSCGFIEIPQQGGIDAIEKALLKQRFANLSAAQLACILRNGRKDWQIESIYYAT